MADLTSEAGPVAAGMLAHEVGEAVAAVLDLVRAAGRCLFDGWDARGGRGTARLTSTSVAC